jgi:hypothetical protein
VLLLESLQIGDVDLPTIGSVMGIKRLVNFLARISSR